MKLDLDDEYDVYIETYPSLYGVSLVSVVEDDVTVQNLTVEQAFILCGNLLEAINDKHYRNV